MIKKIWKYIHFAAFFVPFVIFWLWLDSVFRARTSSYTVGLVSGGACLLVLIVDYVVWRLRGNRKRPGPLP